MLSRSGFAPFSTKDVMLKKTGISHGPNAEVQHRVSKQTGIEEQLIFLSIFMDNFIANTPRGLRGTVTK